MGKIVDNAHRATMLFFFLLLGIPLMLLSSIVGVLVACVRDGYRMGKAL